MSDFFKKLGETFTSVKFYVLITATVLFYIGKLNQDGWIQMVLVTTGFRVVNEVAALLKDIKGSGTTVTNNSTDSGKKNAS